MSSEPVKLEVDCAVTPYSHHHHHHHHHHSHHHVNQVEEEDDDEFVEEEDEDDDEDEEEEDDEENFRRARLAIDVPQTTGHRNYNNELISDDSGGSSSTNSSEQHNGNASRSNESSPSSSSSSFAGESDGSEADEEDEVDEDEQVGDDENAGDDDGDDGDNDEADEDEIEEDDDDEEDESENEDIVDPVGHHHHHQQNHQQQLQPATIGSNLNIVCNEKVNSQIDNNLLISDDDEEEEDQDEDEDEDDDVSFDGTCDDNNISSSPPNNLSADLLDGERMLEVTRKLVRSTERDPDRDLRKQVLLKTAIRKLPHFIEYNRYSDSFEQNFQAHNNNNNNAVNCLTSTQYYEHHHIHLNHHLDSQPKSYYHSVQPNAIQMSTTSLKMLDLNDDQEADMNNIETDHHQLGYAVTNDNNGTSLDQEQHNYANHQQQQASHNLYDHYNQIENHSQPQHPSHDHSDHQNEQSHQRVLHDSSPYSQEAGDCQTGMIGRHTSLDNLYQSSTASDMTDDLKTNDRIPIAFQAAYGTCNFTCAPDDTKKLIDVNNTCQNHQQITSAADREDTLASDRLHHHHNHFHHHSNHHHITTANAYYNNEIRTPMKELETNLIGDEFNGSSLPEENESIEEIVTPTNCDAIDGCEGSSSSSQSSTASDSSVNSIVSQSNDSVGDLNGTSLLEASLNSSSDFYHSSHDSGVALFSPRSNKRSSSAIGLDDEMEIDHLTDLTPSAQQNSGIVTNINHYKKLRKREIID